MDAQTQKKGRLLVLSIQGRLDAFGAGELQELLDRNLDAGIDFLALDLATVEYLSSAGLRTLILAHKKLSARSGGLVLAGLQKYCREVLEVTGFAQAFLAFPTLAEAEQHCVKQMRGKANAARWDGLETAEQECGTFRIMEAGHGLGSVDVLGDVQDVLYSRITHTHLFSKRFFETEYSIGLGGLGRSPADYFGIMGEMITIGGTMVWLPTDGHDMPDFLIPQTDKGQVMIRTGYNVALAGGFNEFMLFESHKPEGADMASLYRALFALSRRRRPDFKGVLGLAIRAQAGAILGSGIRRSPIAENRPSDGAMITAPAHMAGWFECDTQPRHRNVTALICGVGADLTGDLSGFDQGELNKVFYLHPANVGGKSQMLHNHAVVFNEQTFPEKPTDLEEEVRRVVRDGQFVDMRHLLDNSTIVRAFLGVSYIQEFRPDVHGERFAEGAEQGLSPVAAREMSYYRKT